MRSSVIRYQSCPRMALSIWSRCMSSCPGPAAMSRSATDISPFPVKARARSTAASTSGTLLLRAARWHSASRTRHSLSGNRALTWAWISGEPLDSCFYRLNRSNYIRSGRHLVAMTLWQSARARSVPGRRCAGCSRGSTRDRHPCRQQGKAAKEQAPGVEGWWGPARRSRLHAAG
jgi:hypothetical protein